MKKNIVDELKKLDVEIARKLFSISKENNIPEPPSPLQAKIIDYLIINEGKEIYQKDLEKVLNVSKATVSSALLTMEKNNIIKRLISKEDARSKQIVVTDEIIKAHGNMKKVFGILNEELTNGLSNEEIEKFFQTIEKLRANIRKTKF